LRFAHHQRDTRAVAGSRARLADDQPRDGPRRTRSAAPAQTRAPAGRSPRFELASAFPALFDLRSMDRLALRQSVLDACGRRLHGPARHRMRSDLGWASIEHVKRRAIQLAGALTLALPVVALFAAFHPINTDLAGVPIQIRTGWRPLIEGFVVSLIRPGLVRSPSLWSRLLAALQRTEPVWPALRAALGSGRTSGRRG